MPLRTLSEQPPKDLPEIEEDQGGDTVWAKARVLWLPNGTLPPHDELPLVSFISIIITSAARRSPQSPSRVKADQLHDAAGTVADAGTTCAGSNGRPANAGMTVAAGGGRGWAGIAVHRACNPGMKELRHRGHGWWC